MVMSILGLSVVKRADKGVAWQASRRAGESALLLLPNCQTPVVGSVGSVGNRASKNGSAARRRTGRGWPSDGWATCASRW